MEHPEEEIIFDNYEDNYDAVIDEQEVNFAGVRQSKIDSITK